MSLIVPVGYQTNQGSKIYEKKVMALRLNFGRGESKVKLTKDRSKKGKCNYTQGFTNSIVMCRNEVDGHDVRQAQVARLSSFFFNALFFS